MPKTLVKKETGEFIKYLNGDFYSGDIPTLLSDDATLETLVSYAQQFDDTDITPLLDEIELKPCKIIIE